jgi:hypothetical protein
MLSFALAFLLAFSGNLPIKNHCGCVKVTSGEAPLIGGEGIIMNFKPRYYRQIRGVVVFPDGTPAADSLAEIFVDSYLFSEKTWDKPEERRIAVCKTTANGKFCFPNLPPGKYELRIRLNAFDTTRFNLIVAPQNQTSSGRQIKVVLSVRI